MKISFKMIKDREYEVIIEAERDDPKEGAFLDELVLLIDGFPKDGNSRRELKLTEMKPHRWKTWAGYCLERVKLLFKC